MHSAQRSGHRPNETAVPTPLPDSYNSLNQTTSITTAGSPIAIAYADIGQSERTSPGPSSYLNGLLGTRRSGGSALAFTRTPAGSYYIFDGSRLGHRLSVGSSPYGRTLRR